LTARSVTERWSLYVLRCGDGSLYCGIALDVARRLSQHRDGKGARYTRGRGPLVVVARVRCRDRSAALRAELAFKRLPRARKEEIVARARGLQRFVALAARPPAI
jgi:predicted GIY-YIG superfamily endonuclease